MSQSSLPQKPPLLVTDGKYLWAHHMGMKIGPLNPADSPFNPEFCIGGKVHLVENGMFPPAELLEEATP